MKAYNTWLMVAVGLLLVALFLAMYQGFGISGIIVTLVIVAAAIIAYVVYSASSIRVGELEYGVIFKRNGDFSRFVGSGRQYINPLMESLEATLPKGSIKASGTNEKMRTAEGITVTITSWSLSGKIDPFSLNEGSRSSVGRGLIKGASGMLAGKVVPALRHIIEQKSIDQLYSAGAIQSLELELSELVTKRAAGIGFKPIQPNDVQIGTITLPAHVEKMLEMAHEQNIQQTRFRTPVFSSGESAIG